MIVLSHPEWWLDHVDELVDALTVAAQAPVEPAGHASLSSTQIYTRAAGHHVREAAHALPVRGQLRQLSPVRNNTEKNER